MHATLVELLENFKAGLLWVQKDGVVRYANADATARTGLVPGRKLYDPDLLRAVTAAVAQGATVQLASAGSLNAPTRAAQLRCRVLPGLARDDAFVMIAADHGEHGVAFDNLLSVVRSDLREPLQEARASLPAAAWAAVEPVLAVLDKLLDLADLWASDSLLTSDRIEPWKLLQEVWQELAPLARERSVTVRLDAHGAGTADLAAIYGSESWLRRVFVEVMGEALGSARPGDTVDIDYRQLGPRALIAFRDCGAFAGARAGAVKLDPRGGAPAGSKVEAARQHIGLKLCQHIVSLHGGRLREELEDGLRNFVIDLPTGAPHAPAEAQLDIAQAQRYAHDLAALMARARRPRTES